MKPAILYRRVHPSVPPGGTASLQYPRLNRAQVSPLLLGCFIVCVCLFLVWHACLGFASRAHALCQQPSRGSYYSEIRPAQSNWIICHRRLTGIYFPVHWRRLSMIAGRRMEVSVNSLDHRSQRMGSTFSAWI
jgi:hypothetical protein